MFIHSEKINLNNKSKDVFNFIVSTYDIAIVEGELYINVSVEGLDRDTQDEMSFYKEDENKNVEVKVYRCFKDEESAKDAVKDYYEDIGKDLFFYFDKETVCAWAKGDEYAHGYLNFTEWVEDQSENNMGECLSSYDGSESECIYIDTNGAISAELDYQEIINLDSSSISSLICKDMLSKENKEIEFTKMDGFLSDKNSHGYENNFSIALKNLEVSIEKNFIGKVIEKASNESSESNKTTSFRL